MVNKRMIILLYTNLISYANSPPLSEKELNKGGVNFFLHWIILESTVESKSKYI